MVSPSDGCAVTHVKQIGVSGPWWSGHISTSRIPAGRNMWGLYRHGSIQFALEWNSYCENPTCSKVSFRISLKPWVKVSAFYCVWWVAHLACLLWLRVFKNLYGKRLPVLTDICECQDNISTRGYYKLPKETWYLGTAFCLHFVVNCGTCW